jgi:hypothetical protein
MNLEFALFAKVAFPTVDDDQRNVVVRYTNSSKLHHITVTLLTFQNDNRGTPRSLWRLHLSLTNRAHLIRRKLMPQNSINHVHRDDDNGLFARVKSQS